MTKDEALKLALEAIEGVLDDSPKVLEASITGGLYEVVQCRDAITAIKEALAQAEPWEKFCDSNCVWTDHHPDCKLAQRKPLTDEDLRKLADKHLFYQPEGYEVSGVFAFARAIEVAHGIKGEA